MKKLVPIQSTYLFHHTRYDDEISHRRLVSDWSATTTPKVEAAPFDSDVVPKILLQVCQPIGLCFRWDPIDYHSVSENLPAGIPNHIDPTQIIKMTVSQRDCRAADPTTERASLKLSILYHPPQSLKRSKQLHQMRPVKKRCFEPVGESELAPIIIISDNDDPTESSTMSVQHELVCHLDLARLAPSLSNLKREDSPDARATGPRLLEFCYVSLDQFIWDDKIINLARSPTPARLPRPPSPARVARPATPARLARPATPAQLAHSATPAQGARSTTLAQGAPSTTPAQVARSTTPAQVARSTTLDRSTTPAVSDRQASTPADHSPTPDSVHHPSPAVSDRSPSPGPVNPSGRTGSAHEKLAVLAVEDTAGIFTDPEDDDYVPRRARDDESSHGDDASTDFDISESDDSGLSTSSSHTKRGAGSKRRGRKKKGSSARSSEVAPRTRDANLHELSMLNAGLEDVVKGLKKKVAKNKSKHRRLESIHKSLVERYQKRGKAIKSLQKQIGKKEDKILEFQITFKTAFDEFEEKFAKATKNLELVNQQLLVEVEEKTQKIRKNQIVNQMRELIIRDLEIQLEKKNRDNGEDGKGLNKFNQGEVEQVEGEMK